MASSGFTHGFGFLGAAKRSGGAAKGMPRNLLTCVEEEGTEVVVPITTPESTVAVGIALVMPKKTEIAM